MPRLPRVFPSREVRFVSDLVPGLVPGLVSSLVPSLAVLLVLGLTLSGPSSALAQTELNGQTSSGAFYKITVPDGWQPADGLVLWNHGFDLSPIGPVDSLGPLADLQLAEGYAVAASSYSLPGWALFNTVRDSEEMVDAFEGFFGEPDQVLLFGASLGGIVTAQQLEQADLGNVVGAYPICGAVAGSRVWDGGLDLLLIYDAVCSGVPGGTLPGVDGTNPFPPNPLTSQAAFGAALQTCTGIFSDPADRSADQAARLQKILDVTLLPENFLVTDMSFGVYGLGDLFFDPNKLNQRAAFDNVGVDYGDEEINENIQRVASNPFDRLFLMSNYTPSGEVGGAKIMSLHTDKDGLVIVENETAYAAVVPPENLTVAIAVEDTPSHCEFTAAELVSGWESLRAWVAGAPQPTAADWQATCQALDAGGLADGPCRIDPAFVLTDLDGRVRPRAADQAGPPECVEDDTTLCLQQDRFQVRIAFEDPNGTGGDGMARPLETDTGAFWFRRATNLEVTVKVLDGRNSNGFFWVFFASMTNVSFELEVLDTVTGARKTYTNPQGTLASVADTKAF